MWIIRVLQAPRKLSLMLPPLHDLGPWATGTTTELPPTDPTGETECLASDKSISSFWNGYNQPINEEDIKEADALAKAQADNPVDLTKIQFKFSMEQLEQDR